MEDMSKVAKPQSAKGQGCQERTTKPNSSVGSMWVLGCGPKPSVLPMKGVMFLSKAGIAHHFLLGF